MKTLLTILTAFTFCWVSAQTAIHPQGQIEALQREKYPFIRFDLFHEGKPLNQPNLPNAQSLHFQETEAKKLLQNPAYAIEVELPTEQGVLNLLLFQVNWYAMGYELIMADGSSPVETSEGIHYRGMLKDVPGSVVALSVFNDEAMGLISTLEQGNLTLAKYQSSSHQIEGMHVLYNEELIPNKHQFECHTPDGQRGYSAQELEDASTLRAESNCVNLYLEVDYDVFVDKGGVEATNRYIAAVMNEVSALYAKEGIRLNLSQVYVWNTTSPYTAYDAYGLLIQFKNKRAGLVQADAGMLISYKGGGGIAVVNGLCDPFNLGYAGIGKNYSIVPAYSFTVMVIAHELGHILGSHHTHACVWNGNDTAIDGCPGFTDGGCPVPPLPKQGGTMMSYCHITQYGINFALGFGPQPINVIKNRIATAACMSACSTIVVPPPTCGEISFNLVLDNYGNETSWEILDVTNAVVARGGPYAIRQNGKQEQHKLCLPAGCYTLRVIDSRNDGLCCRYGNGSFELLDNAGKTMAKGGSFTKESLTPFCIDNLGRQSSNVVTPSPNKTGCIDVVFSNSNLIPFGESQDQGTYSVLENGKGAGLNGNAWKALAFNYTITAKTMLEFEFRSSQEGEIQGIGFDNDLNLSTIYTFQIWGTQTWGYQEFKTYPGGGVWKKYLIPVGQRYTGDTKYLFFACDNDGEVPGVNAQFRNVKIYEEKPCSPTIAGTLGPVSLKASPNPARNYLNLQMENFPLGTYQVQLLDVLGKLVYQQKIDYRQTLMAIDLPVHSLPKGVYVYQVVGENVKQAGKVVVQPDH